MFNYYERYNLTCKNGKPLPKATVCSVTYECLLSQVNISKMSSSKSSSVSIDYPESIQTVFTPTVHVSVCAPMISLAIFSDYESKHGGEIT